MVLLEVLLSPSPQGLPEAGVTRQGKGARTELRLEVPVLCPHPLALGPLPGRPATGNWSQPLLSPTGQAGTTLPGWTEGGGLSALPRVPSPSVLPGSGVPFLLSLCALGICGQARPHQSPGAGMRQARADLWVNPNHVPATPEMNPVCDPTSHFMLRCEILWLSGFWSAPRP